MSATQQQQTFASTGVSWPDACRRQRKLRDLVHPDVDVDYARGDQRVRINIRLSDLDRIIALLEREGGL